MKITIKYFFFLKRFGNEISNKFNMEKSKLATIPINQKENFNKSKEELLQRTWKPKKKGK